MIILTVLFLVRQKLKLIEDNGCNSSNLCGVVSESKHVGLEIFGLFILSIGGDSSWSFHSNSLIGNLRSFLMSDFSFMRIVL